MDNFLMMKKKITINRCIDCPHHEHDNQEMPLLYGKDVCWSRDNSDYSDGDNMPVILGNDCISTISSNCGLDDA